MAESEAALRVKRHRLSTRLWHWVNALTVFVMLMSGLMIFNAHPRLYWGQYGANPDHAWLEIRSTETTGYLGVAGIKIPTTGVLGIWRNGEGEMKRSAFPGWVTIPSYYSLSSARRWHLSFAWLLVVGQIAFLARALFNRHVQRDLLPRREELKPRHILRDIAKHARFDFSHAAGDASYNILQKLSYGGVIFLLLPLLILTGLTMSPGANAAFPWLLDLFAGRQSARSIHFIAATLIALFIFVHILMVLLSGPINGIRSMITGWFRFKEKAP